MHTIDEVVGFGWESGNVGDDLTGAEILYADYQIDGYEGDALVLFRKDGKFFEARSSHCSCNGLDWEPVEITDPKNFIREYYGRDNEAITKVLTAAGIL